MISKWILRNLIKSLVRMSEHRGRSVAPIDTGKLTRQGARLLPISWLNYRWRSKKSKITWVQSLNVK